MTLDEFRQSLTATEPPAGLTQAVAGLLSRKKRVIPEFYSWSPSSEPSRLKVRCFTQRGCRPYQETADFDIGRKDICRMQVLVSIFRDRIKV